MIPQSLPRAPVFLASLIPSLPRRSVVHCCCLLTGGVVRWESINRSVCRIRETPRSDKRETILYICTLDVPVVLLTAGLLINIQYYREGKEKEEKNNPEMGQQD
jgi:hypothetical protein